VLDPPEAGVRSLALWSLLARSAPAAVTRSVVEPDDAEPGTDAAGAGEPGLATRGPATSGAAAAGAWEVAGLLRRARAAGESPVVTEYEAARVLAAVGVPFAASAVAADEDEAVRLAGDMGGAVALKALSPQVTHRSREGLVRLGVEGEAPVRAAYRVIAARLAAIEGAVLDGVLVQEMLPPGRELLVGLERDPQFGPVVVLGLGGTDVEAWRRICVRVPPVDGDEVAEMLEELGLSDLAGVCRQRLAAVLSGVGALGALAGDVVESVDVNPLVVGGDGRVRAADALIVLRADA
jgi:succinyl-CoA synthetase beta subunit